MKRDPEQRAPVDEQQSYSAPALEKGLDILELLAAAGEPMSTRRISEALGRSKSEIFRVVHVLMRRGYLIRESGNDALYLSRRLFDLGIRTPRGRQLVSVVLPHMERFSQTTGHVAHLVVLSRGETVVVAKTAGDLDAAVSVRLGYGRPALEANSGLTILAFQPEDRLNQLLKESGSSVVRMEALNDLNQKLTQIRTQKYYISESKDLIGVTDIICPILDANETAVACVTVPCLQRHGAAIDDVQISNELMVCCQNASREIHE
jgi:DNA-binding IclR family transcriptional regulator